MSDSAAQVVMVVDDDWMIREIVQAHLEAAGYGVLSAPSGEKALELAASYPPDLVILDVRMQGISGYEVCERLRSAEATRYTAILVTTAMDDDATRLRAIEAGADDFLMKPFEALILLTRVRSLLRIKGLYDELARREQRLWDVLTRHTGEETAGRILNDLSSPGA